MATSCRKVMIYFSVVCVSFSLLFLLVLQIHGFSSRTIYEIVGCNRNGNGVIASLKKERHSPLFIFRDSFFDSGNNNYFNTDAIVQSNFDPYGQTFFRFPTGRFSDGRVIPDFIAEYAKLPLLSPFLYPGKYEKDYVYGMNFASAGAGTLVETHQGMVIDLKSQARHFREFKEQLKKKVGDVEAKALISRAVFLFNVGANDYLTYYLLPNSTGILRLHPTQFVDVVIGNITTVIQEIYMEGGRRFGFLNVPPMNCFPFIRRIDGSSISECQKEGSSILAMLHNTAFSKTLQKLQKQLQGLTYSLFDFNSAVLQLMEYPSKYGFKEGNVACCGGGAYRGDNSCGGKRGIKVYELCKNVSEFVYFDYVHPTEAAAQYYAKLMWFGDIKIVYPLNLKQLFQIGNGINRDEL